MTMMARSFLLLLLLISSLPMTIAATTQDLKSFADNHDRTDEEESSSHQNGSSDHFQPMEYQQIPIVEDSGFYRFTFGEGNSGNYALQSFYYSNSLFTQIRVFDCFEAGDKFLVHDQPSNLLYSVMSSCNNGIFRYFSTDPIECMTTSEMWCNSGWIVMLPGFHNLTIEVVASPYLSGVGYIILQQLCIIDTFLYPCCELNGGTCNYSMAPTEITQSSSSSYSSINRIISAGNSTSASSSE